MKVTYNYGSLKLESEDARDEIWMEEFLKTNKKNKEIPVSFFTADKEWKKLKQYNKNLDIIDEINIGEI
jgi:hypothetical protein